MDFKNFFEFESSLIPLDLIMDLSESSLDTLYSSGDDFDKFNVFFTLLNEYHYLESIEAFKETAHVCYLISYYLFTPLTPPYSEELALVYAKKAIQFDKTKKYDEWLEYV